MSTTVYQRPSLSPPKTLSLRRKFLFSLIVFSIFIIALLLLSELILRKKGLSPWIIHAPFSSIEPPGRFNLPDAELGYLPRSGASRITIPGPYTFTMTHLSSGFRITHPLDTYPAKSKPEIWIFGCSFTHGWSLNDEQTYAWVLQEKLPAYAVANYGIGAGSSVQSLIQLRKNFAKGQKPDVVILAYASMHDVRNTVTRGWMKLRMTGSVGYIPRTLSLPYMRWSADKLPKISYIPVDYRGVTLLQHSALANFLDDKYNEMLEPTYHSHEVSKAIIAEFARLCSEKGITFVVAGIVSDPATTEMLNYCRSVGIMTVDISVDLNVKENTNFPYDRHPSAIANQQYALKLYSFLCNKLIKSPPCGS
jgi:hypothetical protein